MKRLAYWMDIISVGVVGGMVLWFGLMPFVDEMNCLEPDSMTWIVEETLFTLSFCWLLARWINGLLKRKYR